MPVNIREKGWRQCRDTASRAFLMAVGVTIGEMLAEEEHVHLVCPYHVADEQIVCPLIAILARLLRRPAGFDEDFFMRIEQSRDLRRH
jgi:hypothetical protein